MNVDPEYIIQIDYNSDIPKSVRILKPVLFHEGNAYCCLLGEDPQEGIFGCGQTKEGALEDWDKDLKERISKMDADDAIVQEFVRDLETKLW